MAKLSNARYFENIIKEGESTALLRSNCLGPGDQRLCITYRADTQKVTAWRWMHEYDYPLVSDVSHVVLDHTESGGDVILSLDEIPVSVSPYPSEDVNVEAFEKNKDELWAIGYDSKRTLWTFFKKPNVFGDYWIAKSITDKSKGIQERTAEKLSKGYSRHLVVQSFKFSSTLLDLTVR